MKPKNHEKHPIGAFYSMRKIVVFKYWRIIANMSMESKENAVVKPSLPPTESV